MAVKAVTTAFLVWQKEQAPIHEAGELTSWNMYRRELKAFNRNKLIVLNRPSFGIFFSHEVFVLAGVHAHDIEKELNISRAQIHTR